MSLVAIQTLAGLTIAGVLAGAACGGGDDTEAQRTSTTDGSPTRTPESEITQMVLQPEDLPEGFHRTDIDGKIELAGEDGSQAALSSFLMAGDESTPEVASRFAEFEWPASEAVPGDTICILSFAATFETPEDAELALSKSIRLTNGDFGGTPEVEVEPLEEFELGYPGVIYGLRSSREDLCSAYKDQPVDGYVIYLTNETVYGALIMWTAERGAEFGVAALLGQKQFERMGGEFEAND